jgi:hypothetical protein
MNIFCFFLLKHKGLGTIHLTAANGGKSEGTGEGGGEESNLIQ